MKTLIRAQDITATQQMAKFIFMKFYYKILINFLLITLLLSCNSNKKTEKQTSKIKTYKSQFQKQIRQIEYLKKSMTEYMNMAHPSYAETDINECTKILTAFIEEINKAETKKAGMLIVKSSVLKLNELNEKCEYELIETGEREQITEIIITAGHQKGYNSLNEDITGNWREW